MNSEEKIESKVNIIVGEIILMVEKVRKLYNNLKMEGISLGEHENDLNENDVYLSHIALNFYKNYKFLEKLQSKENFPHPFYNQIIEKFSSLNHAIQQIECSNKFKELSRDIFIKMQSHLPIFEEIRVLEIENL